MGRPKKVLPNTPKVENKHNLTLKKVRAMSVNWDKVGKTDSHWQRNNAINAWCLSKEIGSKEDLRFGTSDSYTIAFYDEGTVKRRFKIMCDSYGGMCGYNFNEFYKPRDIDGIVDLHLQEQLLKELNKLIDDGVLFEENKDSIPIEQPSKKSWKV